MRAIHGSCVRDVDYNPNRPWYLVTCGDDDTTKFWDVRRGGDVPVKTLRSHKHWCEGCEGSATQFFPQLMRPPPPACV